MFESHKLNESGQLGVHFVKQTMADATERILNVLPEGREKSLFMTKIEEAVFFGVKAIASKKPNHTATFSYSADGVKEIPNE